MNLKEILKSKQRKKDRYPCKIQINIIIKCLCKELNTINSIVADIHKILKIASLNLKLFSERDFILSA